jgi:hypothetical protein
VGAWLNKANKSRGGDDELRQRSRRENGASEWSRVVNEKFRSRRRVGRRKERLLPGLQIATSSVLSRCSALQLVLNYGQPDGAISKHDNAIIFPYHNGKIRSGEVGLLIFGVVQEVKAVFLA